MKPGRGRIKARERLGLLKFHLVLAATKTLFRGKIGNLNNFERKTFSQYGEDGIIEALFSTIGTTKLLGLESGGMIFSRGILRRAIFRNSTVPLNTG